MSYLYRFEPPTDFEEEHATSCLDCNEDCPGIYLIMRGVDDE